MRPHLLHELLVQLGFKFAAGIMMRNLELGVRAVNARKVADLRGIDEDLGGKFRLQAVIKSVGELCGCGGECVGGQTLGRQELQTVFGHVVGVSLGHAGTDG
jgi:hypothetical protein